MEKIEDMENRNKNQETVKTDKTDSAIFSESLKSLMQIFVESAKVSKCHDIFATFAIFATSASANFVGKESNESTERYGVKSRIPSCYLRYASDFTSGQSRLDSVSLVSRQSDLATFVGRIVAVVALIFTLGVGSVWGTGQAITLSNGSHNGTTNVITWTASNICTITQAPGGGQNETSPSSSYVSAPRWYKYNVITFTAASGIELNSVVVTCTSDSYATTLAGSTYTRTGGTGSVSAAVGTGANTSIVTITCTGTVTAFTIAMGGQARLSAITVNYTTSTPASAYTVTFYKTDGSTQAITEASAGAGVTPPAMQATCGDWSFQGWSKSQSTSTTSTTELTTVTLTTGKYYPTANTTLYPVYTYNAGKVFGKYELLSTGSTVTNGKYLISTGSYTMAGSGNSGASFSPGTTEATAKEYTIATVTGGFSILGPDSKYVGGKSGTDLKFGTTVADNSYKWTYPSNGIQNVNTTDRYIRAYRTTDFRHYQTGSGTQAKLYKRIEVDLIYYYSYPTCCDELGYINGSVSFTNPTTAVLTWNKMSNVADSDPYTISYRTGSAAYGTTNVGDVNLTGSKATCTITGLSCNTSYDFKIEVAADDGYCDKDTTMTGKNSGKWTITKTGSGTVTGGTFTTKISGSAVTGACSGDQIDIVATNANGYAFSSWTVGKEGGGSVTPDAATASTYFSMPADNVTVTAAFSCVQPSFTVHPASKTDYLTTESATPLGYTASAAGASLTQQWQSSSDNSSWSNIVGATNSTYTPDISSEGTTYYRVIVTNSACSESRTSNVATITSVTPSVCKTPTFSVDEGTYTTNKSVTLSCATDGATIYYTTDNSTPTAESTEYTGAISVTQTTTIKAIAVADGLDPSLVASATYTIQCATPTFSVTAGTYVGSKSVAISTTYGTTIYYTTNGDEPTTGSTAYSSAITVGTSQTVKAIAYKSGCTNSAIGSAAYTIQCAPPTFSPTAGTYNANQTVYLSSTYGDNFYYTLDGTDPTTLSTAYNAEDGISITATKTLKAIATKTGCDNSSASSATYTMKCATPTFYVTAGTYTGAQTVAISSTTPGVTIYYTTNNSTPTTSSTAYSSAITVSSNQTVKAIAVKDGWTNSDVGQASYTIKHTITWHVNGSTYSTGVDDDNTYVVDGEKIDDVPTAPANNTLNDCANKFMGWSSKNATTTPKTTSYYDDLFTDVAGSPEITDDIDFYAVFAEGEDGTAQLTTAEITAAYCSGSGSCGSVTSYANGPYDISSNDGNWEGAVCAINNGNIGMRATDASQALGRPRLISPDYGGSVTKITISATNGSSDDRYIYICSSATASPATENIGSGTATKKTTTDVVIEPSSAVSSFYIYVNDALTFTSIEVEYSSGENYVTQCAANQVRVTYDFNGGTGTACTEGVTTKSASYTICSTEPEKNYYDFAGWSDGTNTYDAGDTYNLQATTEFTATWTPTVYTITYNLNGGTQQVTPAAPTSYTVESSAVTLPTPTKSHDRFDGWYANVGLTGDVQTTIAAGSNGNKEYWAKWTARNEIKFYADDNLLSTIYRATDENLQASVAGQGSKPDDPSAPSACSSKVFMGWTETWFNDETDTEPADLNDATGTRTGAKTYYAVWATRAGSPGSYTYSAYSTTCCGKSVEVDGGSPSNGTVAFDKSYVWTCKEDREVVMTITPAAGYQLHTFNVATGDGKVAAKSMSADVALDNNSSAAQVITLTFAKDADGDYVVTATFTDMVVTNWSWTNHNGGAAITTDPIEVYVDQKAQVDVTYTPAKADLLSTHTAKEYYSHDATGNAYVKSPTKASEYFTFYGKASTGEETTTITLTHNDDTSSPKAFQQLIYVKVKPLPLVHFVDNVHNESFDDVVATTDGSTVTFTKTTPTHGDLDEPGTGNSCEKSHLHLIGWIRGDWPAYVAYMNGTGDAPSNSDLTGATGYFYAPGASITLTDAMHGMTFYAIWAKVE